MAAPAAGALYTAPPIPADFAAYPPAAAVQTPILSSCYAVTTGPDRHLYWVYDGMVSSATAIATPVTPSCCFETQESMAISQNKTHPRQRCGLCNQSVARHMTAAQATTAFAAHANAFPATHVTLNTPIPVGALAPAGYASVNGTIAPIAAPILPPAPALAPAAIPGLAPIPAPALGVGVAPLVASVPVIPAGPADPRDWPSSINVNDVPSYQMLTNMVKVNTTSVWSADMEAYQFITGLEVILRGSPVRHEYWTALIMLMIPGSFPLERDWVYTNIISQRLSWNQARASFTQHYQRSDYMDGRRELYKRCTQTKDETTQEYSRRFQTLATQLRYPDNDSQAIHRYLQGLPPWLQKKMSSHKSNMRTIAAIPVLDWDFTSLSVTISLAIMFAAEPQVVQRKVDTTPLPQHLQTSVLANPDQVTSTSTSTSTCTSTSSSNASNKNGKNNKRKASTPEKGENKEKTEKKQKDKEHKQCQYHPSSTTHTTAECRAKGNLQADHSSESPPASGKSRTEVPPTSTPTVQTRARQRTSASQQQDLSKVQCFKCLKHGHYASTCTQPVASTGQQTSTNRRSLSVNSRRTQVQQPQVAFKDEDEAIIPSTSLPAQQQ
jgi:hypothetical protein